MFLTEICANLRNYFCRNDDKHFGEFTISGGTLAPLDFLQSGQYFRIVGSVFNDGVYQYGDKDVAFTDETFDGAIWAMRVPPDVIALAAEIEAYNNSEAAKPSAFTSESFGGYSYSRATDKNGAPISWQTAFATKLNKWRKI